MALTKAQVKSYYNKATYLSNNSDVATLATTNSWTDDQIFDHYYAYGLAGDRIASLTYIKRDYAANNSELNSYAIKNNWTGDDWLSHYINYGKTEGRVASHIFNKADYLSLNSDLATYYAAHPTFDLDNHYQTIGSLESRRAIKSTTALDYRTIENTNPMSGGAGQTVVLDNLNDIYIGTAGDDKFVSTLDAGGQPTLTASTVIDGKAGRNSLNARALPAGTLKPTLSNVQNISLKATADGLVFDVANTKDLASIAFNSSPYTGTVQNIKSMATELGVVNAVNAAKTYNFKYKLGAIDNSKYSFLTLNNALGTVTVTDSTATNNPANIIITSKGDANAIVLTDNGTKYKKVVTNGSASLDFSTSPLASVTYFDSTAATGNVTANITNTAPAIIKTGSGNDSITHAGYTPTEVIDLGAGTNIFSTTSAKAIAAAATITTGSTVTNLKNVQAFGISDPVAGNFEFAKFGVKTLLLAGSDVGTARTISKIASDTYIKFNTGVVGADANNLILGITDTTSLTNALNLVFTTAQNHYLTANSVQTINVQADVAGVNVKLNTDSIKTLNVVGNGGIDFTLTAGKIGSTITTIDASQLVGNFDVAVAAGGTSNVTIKGSLTGQNIIIDGSKNDTVTGGANNDLFATFRGVDTFTGGTGLDEYQIGAGGAAAYDNTNTATNKVIITDFNPGTNTTSVDTLTFSVGGFTGNQVLMNGAGTSVGAGAVSILSITATGNTAIGAGNNLVLYKFGTFASAAALQTQLQTAGTKLTFVNPGANKSFLLAYQNTTDACVDVALVQVLNAATDTAAATVQDIIKLQGVTDFTNIDATDFNAFIA